MKKTVGVCARTICTLLGLTVATAWSQAAPVATYETGYANIAKLSTDLCRALEPKQSQNLLPVPVLLELSTPYVQPSKHFTGSNMVSAVFISEGFINFMNHLSHAMAIEAQQGGYLKQYLGQLSVEEANTSLRSVANQQTWSFDTMNQQVSLFNQMAGCLVAIDMAHHYLGYYQKYSSQLGENNMTPINSVVTPEEWRKAVMRGAHNGLQCGLGVDGLKQLFDSIASMPVRPAWASYIMPKNANVAKIKKDLDRLDEYFFAGRKFLD